MQKLGAATLIAVGFAGTSAMATDMPVYKAKPLPVWTWAGVYFGAHAGGAWGTSSWTTNAGCFVNVGSLLPHCSPVDQKPGGWVVVTTPNQLSALSLVTLIVKRRFSAFQDSAYPAHRTALLESDLVRILAAAGLEQIAVAYSCRGRLPLTAAHVPARLARRMPRACSDNLLVIGRKSRG